MSALDDTGLPLPEPPPSIRACPSPQCTVCMPAGYETIRGPIWRLYSPSILAHPILKQFSNAHGWLSTHRTRSSSRAADALLTQLPLEVRAMIWSYVVGTPYLHCLRLGVKQRHANAGEYCSSLAEAHGRTSRLRRVCSGDQVVQSRHPVEPLLGKPLVLPDSSDATTFLIRRYRLREGKLTPLVENVHARSGRHLALHDRCESQDFELPVDMVGVEGQACDILGAPHSSHVWYNKCPHPLVVSTWSCTVCHQPCSKAIRLGRRSGPLRACKQMYQDIITPFYAQPTFFFTSCEDLSSFLLCVPPQHVSNIRHLALTNPEHFPVGPFVNLDSAHFIFVPPNPLHLEDAEREHVLRTVHMTIGDWRVRAKEALVDILLPTEFRVSEQPFEKIDSAQVSRGYVEERNNGELWIFPWASRSKRGYA